MIVILQHAATYDRRCYSSRCWLTSQSLDSWKHTFVCGDSELSCHLVVLLHLWHIHQRMSEVEYFRNNQQMVPSLRLVYCKLSLPLSVGLCQDWNTSRHSLFDTSFCLMVKPRPRQSIPQKKSEFRLAGENHLHCFHCSYCRDLWLHF